LYFTILLSAGGLLSELVLLLALTLLARSFFSSSTSQAGMNIGVGGTVTKNPRTDATSNRKTPKIAIHPATPGLHDASSWWHVASVKIPNVNAPAMKATGFKMRISSKMVRFQPSVPTNITSDMTSKNVMVANPADMAPRYLDLSTIPEKMVYL